MGSLDLVTKCWSELSAEKRSYVLREIMPNIDASSAFAFGVISDFYSLLPYIQEMLLCAYDSKKDEFNVAESERVQKIIKSFAKETATRKVFVSFHLRASDKIGNVVERFSQIDADVERPIRSIDDLMAIIKERVGHAPGVRICVQNWCYYDK